MKTAYQLMEELDIKILIIMRVAWSQLREDYISRINLYWNDKVRWSDSWWYYWLYNRKQNTSRMQTRVVSNPQQLDSPTILTLDQRAYYVWKEAITFEEHNLYLF